MNPNKIYLAQTDTTAGFLSQNESGLKKVKRRPCYKPFLMEVASLSELKQFTRVPKKFKKVVRRAKKTTFIYPNKKALRVVKDEEHLKFLRKFGWMYSTSANVSGQGFDIGFAKRAADIVVEDRRGLWEGPPSSLLKVGRKKIKRVR